MMKGLIILLIVGAALLMPCSAQVEVIFPLLDNYFRNILHFTQAQQLDGDLPQDAIEEVGDGQKTIMQVSNRHYCHNHI